MSGFSVILLPFVVMFFALGMERIEKRLSGLTVGRSEVDEFLNSAPLLTIAEPDESFLPTPEISKTDSFRHARAS